MLGKSAWIGFCSYGVFEIEKGLHFQKLTLELIRSNFSKTKFTIHNVDDCIFKQVLNFSSMKNYSILRILGY